MRKQELDVAFLSGFVQLFNDILNILFTILINHNE